MPTTVNMLASRRQPPRDSSPASAQALPGNLSNVDYTQMQLQQIELIEEGGHIASDESDDDVIGAIVYTFALPNTLYPLATDFCGPSLTLGSVVHYPVPYFKVTEATTTQTDVTSGATTDMCFTSYYALLSGGHILMHLQTDLGAKAAQAFGDEIVREDSDGTPTPTSTPTDTATVTPYPSATDTTTPTLQPALAAFPTLPPPSTDTATPSQTASPSATPTITASATITATAALTGTIVALGSGGNGIAGGDSAQPASYQSRGLLLSLSPASVRAHGVLVIRAAYAPNSRFAVRIALSAASKVKPLAFSATADKNGNLFKRIRLSYELVRTCTLVVTVSLPLPRPYGVTLFRTETVRITR